MVAVLREIIGLQPCPLVAAAGHHSDLQLLARASEGAAVGLAMSSHGGRLSC